ncbi:ArsR/SmtB family transcription factor [Caldalkalibacillus salinus]|uniref:ArsR/SmtB family transcription factor n=1 Tax=Caldalkalibacillus salinus TaxID=2803787 RepID=UPI0019206379|nr:metalloregulator ArsR/SmtB family transcription factor [Caldalkalibacillus salinus]
MNHTHTKTQAHTQTNSPSIAPIVVENGFDQYEKQFKALADKKRLEIMYQLCQHGEICVCELSGLFNMSQSKISYHLKILLDAKLITKETRGTWHYYALNDVEVNHLLSEELCCIFRQSSK